MAKAQWRNTPEHEKRTAAETKFCPFCPCNEDKTPPEVLAFRKDSPPNSEGWWVRVIPNKIFENHGERAGTSLVHPHSQLVATPMVPRDIRLRFEVAQEYYDDR